MKKTFSILTAICLIAMMAVTVFAEYPGSPAWDWPLPTSGTLIQGEFIGYELGWSSTFATDPTTGNPATGPSAAFDGDSETFFDTGIQMKKWASEDDPYYTGIKADQKYVLTEIRICPRTGYLDRTAGAVVQGSNDGSTWTDIFTCGGAAPVQDYYCVTPEDPNGGTDWVAGEWSTDEAFQYFRYVNPVNPGSVAEVELYGNAAGAAAPVEEAPVETEAPVVEEAPAQVPAAPATADMFVVLAAVTFIALAAVVVFKKVTVR